MNILLISVSLELPGNLCSAALNCLLEVVGGEHMVPHVLGVGYAYNEYEVTEMSSKVVMR